MFFTMEKMHQKKHIVKAQVVKLTLTVGLLTTEQCRRPTTDSLACPRGITEPVKTFKCEPT